MPDFAFPTLKRGADVRCVYGAGGLGLLLGSGRLAAAAVPVS